MKKRILLILLAILAGILLFGCRPGEGLQTQTPPETNRVRWIRFEPQEYILRG